MHSMLLAWQKRTSSNLPWPGLTLTKWKLGMGQLGESASRSSCQVFKLSTPMFFTKPASCSGTIPFCHVRRKASACWFRTRRLGSRLSSAHGMVTRSTCSTPSSLAMALAWSRAVSGKRWHCLSRRSTMNSRWAASIGWAFGSTASPSPFSSSGESLLLVAAKRSVSATSSRSSALKPETSFGFSASISHCSSARVIARRTHFSAPYSTTTSRTCPPVEAWLPSEIVSDSAIVASCPPAGDGA
mmetsp:Transcript_6788/g.16198  ORF Transcript_6788/g.16198 Transcript_6788/m.16198 type:complete len:243 (-) Transcript_6788:142-870(-)